MKIDEKTWMAFKRFCRVKHNPPLAPSTIEDTVMKLRHLEKNGIDLQNFNPDAVYCLFEKKLRDGASGCALNQYIKSLHRWFQFRGITYHFQRYKEFFKPIKIPTPEQIKEMTMVYNRRTCKDRLARMIIVTLTNTGMRVSELCNLKIKDIDSHNLEILVYGKGGGLQKPRIIPVSKKFLMSVTYPSLHNYLSKWRYTPKKEFGEYVFIDQKGKKLREYFVRRVVKKAGNKIGLFWVHPHSFRHFYATNLLRNGVKINVVKEILGHVDISTTARYIHLIEGDLHKAVDKFKDPITLKGGMQSKRNHLNMLCRVLSVTKNKPIEI